MPRWICLLALIAACHPHPTIESPPIEQTSDFGATAEVTLAAHLARHPASAVSLGLHSQDGELPDVSPDGLAANIAAVKERIDAVNSVDTSRLSPRQMVERAVLLTTLRSDEIDFDARRRPWRDPMWYLDALNLTPYISRDYAPVYQRVDAIVAIAKATPLFLQHAKSNLEEAMPRTFVATALMQARGLASFVRRDVPAALPSLPPARRTELAGALAEMATALDMFAAHLEAAAGSANDDFALGEALFSRMLHETQGIDTELPRLMAILQADLERNTAQMHAAAEQIQPGTPVVEVVAAVAGEKPAVGAVLSTAAAQSKQMRQFLIDNAIVTIPTAHVAEVVETPPFMRWNAAFLNGAGAFETKQLPSFYYISPPDPSWPMDKQRAYIPGTTDLLFITIHEVWPGHFLHSLHLKGNESRVLKALWNYTTGEGWAHYAEQMMWEAGVSDDPRVHVGQLLNALLRNVRALSAIGLHTQGWSVEQARKLFVEVAFQDEANAEQQAVRGTFDPMYLAYTVGKLGILRLRDDVRAREGSEFSLQAFHDEFLSYGSAPLSAIRSGMLGEGAGPVL